MSGHVPAILGLGTATFIPGYGLTRRGDPDSRLLRAAIDGGVRYFDTAAAYGDSEAAIGEVADLIASQRVRVCTKIQPVNATPESFGAAVRASLSRMRCAHADTMMLHSVTGSAISDGALASAWRGVTESGLVRKTGASTYGTEDARLAATSSWCDVLQIEYSILNQSVLKALGSLPNRRPEVVARSVLCKGLLTPGAAEKVLPGEAADSIRALEALASGWDMDLATLAIRFALDAPGIDVVIIGVSNLSELQSALGAASRSRLTPEQWARVAAFDRSAADWSHPERWPEGRLTV